MQEEQQVPPPPQQKTEQQLLQQKKQRQQQQRQKQEQRKRLEEQAKAKEIEDIKKLEQACKGSLSGLAKTADNRSMAYSKLVLAQKELERLFPFILQHSQIRYLDLNTNNLSDISVVLDFKNLVSLNVSKNQISSLQVFDTDKLLQLQFLNLSANKIKILRKITLPALRRLNLTQNQISSIDWPGHNNIEILQLRKNKLKKLKGLCNMKNLKQLYVCQNQITDLRGIQNVPSLQKLSLRNNKIKTIISPFPFMPSLKHINLRENQISSIKQLEKIDDHIKSINFLANPLADQLGQNVKRDISYALTHVLRVNKSDITVQQRIQFEKDWKQKEAEKQRQRLQKQAAEQEARKAAQEGKPQQ